MAGGGGRVTGEVRLAPGAPPPSRPATVWIRLMDVSLQDVEARVVSEYVVHGVWLDRSRGVPFALDAASVDPAATYAVQAHVETRGDGRVRPGDWVSMQSYLVLTHGAPRHVVVRTEQV